MKSPILTVISFFFALPALMACGDASSSIAVQEREGNEVVAYCAVGIDVFPVEAGEPSAERRSLPDTLVIKPGFYEVAGHSFDFSRQGLCRIVMPETQNLQRIVYDGDVEALLSSIAWIAAHGNIDDTLSYDEQYKKALTSKLVMTCGHVSLFAQELLAEQGIESRIVVLMTLDPWNSYDNGHGLIEVLTDEGWVLYDLDNNYRLETLSGRGMSVVDFAAAVPGRAYKAVSIANDTRLDVISFRSAASGFNYGFYMEMLYADIHPWYKRVAQVPLIRGEDRNYYFFDEAGRGRIESYSSDFRYMDRLQFMRTFYGVEG